jgi:release factor glutamine methyltransferase
LAGRCTFVACDIASGVEGPFDLLVSNPPYIKHDEIMALAPEVRNYDPTVALDGGADGLAAYRSIASDVRRLLAPGGRMFVELGADQETAVRELFTNAGLTVGVARKDLAGIPRVLGAGFVP